MPLHVSTGRAVINIYATEPKAFDRWAVVVAEALATYAAVGYANNDALARTAAQVTQMPEAMTSRAVIERAKGMLMLERGVTAEDAFDVLVQESMTTNRKLRDVTGELVDRAQRRGDSPAE